VPRTLASTLLAVALLCSPTTAAQCPADDAYEDNDSPGGAVLLPLGRTEGLVAQGPVGTVGFDEDYFLIPDVPPGDVVLAELDYSHPVDRLVLEISAVTSGQFVNGGLLGETQLALTNSSNFAQDFLVSVRTASPSSNCVTYALELAQLPDQCFGVADDAFEDNDSCLAASAVAPGFYPDLFVSASDADHFNVDVPDGFVLTVDQVSNQQPMAIALLESGTVFPLLDHAGGVLAGTRTVTHENQSGSTQTICIQNSIPGPICASYDLSIDVSPSTCATAVDDAFEPNDSCATAVALDAGVNAALFTSESNPDHYVLQVPAGQVLSIDQGFDALGASLEAHLFLDSACSSLAVQTRRGEGANRIDWINRSGATATVYLRCAIASPSSLDCGEYELHVAMTPDPCASVPIDDGFDDNDDCDSARPLEGGAHTGLFVSSDDADYYSFVARAGEKFWVIIDAHNRTAELQLLLFDSRTDCANLQDGWIQAGEALSDSIRGTYVFNWTGEFQKYHLVVRVADESESDCSSYDLSLRTANTNGIHSFCAGDGSAAAGGFGGVGCPCDNASPQGRGEGCANSSGRGAILKSNGVASSLGFGQLQLVVERARPHVPCMLLASTDTTAIPFKDGVFCLGASATRTESLMLDTAGRAQTTQHLEAVSGDRLYYQAWYRDPALSPCGSGSNFTQALAVSWL
jgi:hypothetical protein